MVPKKSNQNIRIHDLEIFPVAAETEPGFGSIHSQTELKKPKYDFNVMNSAQPVQNVVKRITA